MKYIIELEKIDGTELYKAKGFKTLVFDSYGISLLTPYEEKRELTEGCTIKTPNGTTLYEFKGFSNDGYLNVINKSNGKFTCLTNGKYVIVE